MGNKILKFICENPVLTIGIPILIIVLLTIPSFIVYGMTYPEHLLIVGEFRDRVEEELNAKYVISEISHCHREHDNWITVYVKTVSKDEPWKWTNNFVWYNTETKQIILGNLNDASYY